MRRIRRLSSHSHTVTPTTVVKFLEAFFCSKGIVLLLAVCATVQRHVCSGSDLEEMRHINEMIEIRYMPFAAI
jgi:hypothetical protein